MVPRPWWAASELVVRRLSCGGGVGVVSDVISAPPNGAPSALWRCRFGLMSRYLAAESVRDLLGEHHAETSVIGIVLTAVALMHVPTLGRAEHILAVRLGLAVTAAAGTQNYLCGGCAGRRCSGQPCAYWRLGRRLVVRPRDRLRHRRRRAWQGIRTWRSDNCGC